MPGPREASDDLVLWLVELFDELAMDYRRLGEPAGAVTQQRLMELRNELEQRIRDHWGGQHVWVHRAAWQDRTQRDAAIRCDRAGGLSQADTARKYTLSRAQVRRICGELE